ncbi:MAG: LemA family protein [Thiotrichales bacterium]|nr:LemA family protein [Thiotrichales bacterium]
MGTFLMILLGLLVLIIVYMIIIFNTLVSLRNRFLNAFSQIEVQLKRRHDLIPNIVKVAKQAMTHERETLEAVVQARNNAAGLLQEAAKHPYSNQSIAQLAQGEASLNDALMRLNVVMEAYPDLKTNANMLQLTEELSTTENKVAFSRQSYNDSVMFYNTYRQSFPNSIVANSFGHGHDAQLLEFADTKAIQAVPEVSF